MAINADVIEQAVERYERERDRYVKLAARVSDICQREVVRANAIHAQVTSRAKSPESFREKLERFARNPAKKIATVEDVFLQVGDLAAVRIATYQPKDEGRVIDALQKRFHWPNGDKDIEGKDLLQVGNNKYYRATHCQAALMGADLADPYGNLKNTTCEIQVCSMMAHVWNEIEHDIVYKPEGLGPQEAEKVLLGALGGLTRSGDEIITGILSAVQKRLEAQKGPFNDVFDFVARSRDTYPEIDISLNSDQFLEVIQILGLDTPEKLRAAVKEALNDPAGTTDKIAKFNKYLASNGYDTFTLDPKSSDFLLIILLEKFAKKVEDSLPAGRGMGRPSRTRSISSRYIWYSSL